MSMLLKMCFFSGTAVLLLLLLGSCASSPGMQFNPLAGDQGTERRNDSDPVTAPMLRRITPEVVKSEQALTEQQTAEHLTSLIGQPQPYLIGSGDVLSVVVWDHPDLSNVATTQSAGLTGPGSDASTAATTAPPAGFLVSEQGMLEFPYAGSLKVSGLTQEQARSLLASKLARFIKRPKVTLRVQAFRSKRVYVDGAVKSPGLQAINDIPMSLLEAINRAGGILPSGDQSQIIVNRDKAIFRIDLQQLVARGVNPSNVLLADGDVVRVSSMEENKVFVSGEVVSPRGLTMHNGRLSLNEALGEAGGINPLSGDGSQVYVARKTGTEQVIYQLDSRSPQAVALAEGFTLKPKDVVYVAATPLANWHRAISQIFPSALSGAIGAVPLR
ncbi:MAG: polysaccharide biosynthesis/export family protein [Burkholderiaceae bacterium]